MIVAIDYFTKWIEAEPLAKITKRNAKNFVWKNIVCQFGIPKAIITNDAKQFDNNRFKLISTRSPSTTIRELSTDLFYLVT